MNDAQEPHSTFSATPVIVRAHADQPVRLAASEFGPYVNVINEVTGHSIRFPASQVFRYDDSLFSALSAAYANGDAKALTQLWGKAQRVGI